jgi:hypothetical protein
MLFRNMMMKYYDEAGQDGAAGGGAGAGDTPKTYTAAEVDEMIGRRVAEAIEEETKQLKSKNNDLITERRKDQERVAREKARADGKLDEFEQSLRSTFEKEKEPLVAKLTALESRVLGESKKAILGGFSAEFLAPESIDVIGQLVKTELDGDNIKTQFTDFAGNVITTDPAEFKKWMAKHPAISHLMKADAASGGGAMGGKSQAGGAGTLNRQQFDKLDHTARKQFFANGGKLTD